MIGSTSPSSIWVQFYVGLYSSESPSDPVCLAVVGVTVPVFPTVINDREKLMGMTFYRPNKNTGVFLLQ